MTSLYPLRFEPLYRHYLWGGTRLGTLPGRNLAPGKLYAESWEIVDHLADQSVVQSGPLAGASLHELTVEHRKALLGREAACPSGAPVANRFPLLLKLLDAAKNLSLQVHPDNEMASRLDPPELGKTEAWFVLAADSGSRIYAGLKPGVDRSVLARAIEDGTCAECVHSFEPRSGDSLLIPSGTVHGLGEGIMVVELQQASDATFRLFDWNRVGPDGNPRPLHVEQALEAIDFDAGPVEPIRVAMTEKNAGAELIECEYFSIRRWDLVGPVSIGGDGHCHVINVIDGAVLVEGDPAASPVDRGQTILLPAALSPVAVRPEPKAQLLDVTVP
ncbi:MAG: class I mannose-6-phosphate isomerase [Pirellulales bacterium]|nr:class I mannose-6-phosphate isomerase [Pirellulales bacterium]